MKENSTRKQIRDEGSIKDKWNGNSKIFRTYVKGREDDPKAPDAKRIKGVEHILTFQEAAEYDSFGGVMCSGIIDISFDDKEMSERFLKMAAANDWHCLVLGDPDRGHYHTYWKNVCQRIESSGTDKKLSCGLIADIHKGDTYVPLSIKGADRFPPLYDVDPGDEYQEVPEELIPVNTKVNLWDLSEGDGRNDALSRMAKYLTHYSRFSKDQIKRILTNTNEFVFADPLPGNELNTVLRDETFEGLKEVPKLNMISAAELASMNFKPVEFIVEGLIPIGLTILASPPKFGKSWMCMNMALSVASGKDFLKYKVNQCGVLYMALEDRFDRLHQRIKQIQGKDPFPADLNLIVESQTLEDGFIEQMEGVLISNPQIRLIIIDTFVKIRGEPKRNESAYRTDSREAGIIKHFADAHNIAVVLVTHTRKGIDHTDPFINITGTYGVAGAADDMIVLTKDQRSDKNTKMSVNGRDVSFEEFPLIFEADRGTWMCAGDSWDEFVRKEQNNAARYEYDQGNLKKTIMRLLEDNNGVWSGSCKGIIDKSKEYEMPIMKTAQKVGMEIAVINGFLYEDGILHTEIRHGKSGKHHKFELRE